MITFNTVGRAQGVKSWSTTVKFRKHTSIAVPSTGQDIWGQQMGCSRPQRGSSLAKCWIGARRRSGAIALFRNHDPSGRGTCQRQTCTNQHDDSESKYKCLPNRFLNGGSCTGIQTGRWLYAGEFDLVRLDLLQNAW